MANGAAIITAAENRFLNVGTPNWVYGANVNTNNGQAVITVNGDTGLGIDCSHFIYQTMLAAGYNVKYATANTNSTNSFAKIATGAQTSSDYSSISASQAQAGDLVGQYSCRWAYWLGCGFCNGSGQQI